MPQQFLNPYHFVPVKPSGSTNDLAVTDFPTAAGHVTHEQYHESSLSGRIICRLITITPTFIGDKEIETATQTSPKLLSPFQLDGKPAIPSTSLRGLISSIAEAASNSSLRILDDAQYSYRKPFTSPDESLKPLSAIGMILLKDGKLRLRPLCLPTIECERGRPISLPSHWAKFFAYPNLKVYFGQRREIEDKRFTYQTFSSRKPNYYGMRLRQPDRRWLDDTSRTINYDSGMKIKEGKRSFLLAQNSIDFRDLPQQWDKIPEGKRSQYTRGILRVLGVHERRDQIPTGKKHEIFIPYPEDIDTWPTFPISEEVVARFHDLADQRTGDGEDDLLPFSPRGTHRNENRRKLGKKFRLKQGDLVYFRVENTSDGPIIAEVALSSIWRGRVEERLSGELKGAKTHRFFEALSNNLVPFKAGRSVISVAEQMFGFVEEGKESERRSGRALAGRVYFSHALFENIHSLEQNEAENTFVSPYAPEVTLKILGSPKPPSPVMYFRLPNRGSYVRKTDLRPGIHHPQGRKFYLHHQDEGKEPWRTSAQNEQENCLQKVRITPIKANATFYFHIDFDSLSRHELGLLLYALRPSAQFRHKIGMAKPLGLGSITIEPVGVFCVNRKIRYSVAGMFSDKGEITSRYHQTWEPEGENRRLWPLQYERERDAIGVALDIDTVRQEFTQLIDADIKKALELLGDPGKVRHPVHTPLTQDNEDDESETFKWFVANDQGSGRGPNKIAPHQEYLEPLTKDSVDLPTLSIHPWAK